MDFWASLETRRSMRASLRSAFIALLRSCTSVVSESLEDSNCVESLSSESLESSAPRLSLNAA